MIMPIFPSENIADQITKDIDVAFESNSAEQKVDITCCAHLSGNNMVPTGKKLFIDHTNLLEILSYRI